jgi:hypothetical protein
MTVIAAILSYAGNTGAAYLYILILTSATLTIVRLIDQSTRAVVLHASLPAEKYLKSSRYLEIVRQGITFISGGIATFLIKKIIFILRVYSVWLPS